jgi:hypothetical protein
LGNTHEIRPADDCASSILRAPPRGLLDNNRRKDQMTRTLFDVGGRYRRNV